MSFHVKDNFKPGTPVSAVGADWFNKVGGFLNALSGGLGIRIFKPRNPSSAVPAAIEVEPDVLKEIMAVPSSEQGDSPMQQKETGDFDDAGGTVFTWTPGDNGLVLDCYIKMTLYDGAYFAQPCRLTFSKDGLLLKAQGLANRKML